MLSFATKSVPFDVNATENGPLIPVVISAIGAAAPIGQTETSPFPVSATAMICAKPSAKLAEQCAVGSVHAEETALIVSDPFVTGRLAGSLSVNVLPFTEAE